MIPQSPPTWSIQNQDQLPWLVVNWIDEHQLKCATWSIDKLGQSVAIFSSETKAKNFSGLLTSAKWQVVQPDRSLLGQILVSMFSSGTHYLALDPQQTSARQVFELKAVLKGLRDELRKEKNSTI